MRKRVTKAPSGRTPYEDFRTMMTCFHEAGHVVVGHALGGKILWVSGGRGDDRACFEPRLVPSPYPGQTTADRASAISELRRSLAAFCAGLVANTIHQDAVQKRGFRCADERAAYEDGWTVRISLCFRVGQRLEAVPGEDLDQAVRLAHAICLAQAPIPAWKPGSIKSYLAKIERVKKQDRSQQELAEILKAEKKAEAILRRHWAVVEDIATALHKTKSGCLYRRQLLPRLESVPVELR